MAPKKAEEASSERSSKSAKRFCGCEGGGASGEILKKGFQFGIWKVVKKEICENEFGRGCRGGPGQDILGHHSGEPIFSTQRFESGVGECGLAIDEKDARPVPPLRKKGRQESGEKISITRSKVGKAGRWAVGISVSYPANPKPGLPKEGVEALKIGTAGQSRGIRWRKCVEDFGGEAAAHEVTSRRAP